MSGMRKHRYHQTHVRSQYHFQHTHDARPELRLMLRFTGLLRDAGKLLLELVVLY